MEPDLLRLSGIPGVQQQSRILAGELLRLHLEWPCSEAQVRQGLGHFHSECGLEVRVWDYSHWLQISISLSVTPCEDL